jgi:hypothetical protein
MPRVDAGVQHDRGDPLASDALVAPEAALDDRSPGIGGIDDRGGHVHEEVQGSVPLHPFDTGIARQALDLPGGGLDMHRGDHPELPDLVDAQVL